MFHFTTSVGVAGRDISSLVLVHAGAHKRMQHTGLVSADVRKLPYSELLFAPAPSVLSRVTTWDIGTRVAQDLVLH